MANVLTGMDRVLDSADPDWNFLLIGPDHDGNLPIISVDYPERAHFLPFAYWYSSEKELIAVMDKLLRSGCRPKYGREQRVKFLQENSWSERTKQISHSLNCLG